MKGFAAVLVLASPLLALGAVIERALPVGHPVLDNKFLTAANFTLRADIYPSGFAVPTQTLTRLPDGYSVGPTGVYGPDGSTVSAFPQSVLTAGVVASVTSPVSSPPASTQTQGTASPPPNGASRNMLSATGAIAVGAVAFALL